MNLYTISNRRCTSIQSAFLICIALLVLNGCNHEQVKTTDIEQIPFSYSDPNGKSPSSWNKMLHLKLPVGLENGLKFGSDISLEVDNISDSQIRFPAGMNVRIFDTTNGMREIKNSYQYFIDKGEYLTLESKQKKVAWNTLIDLSPEIQSDTDITIRVYIIGEMLFNDTQKNEPVGASIDLVLHP
jgi:hypothetical protein